MSQIQLVARGDIDASLTGNPSITFFKSDKSFATLSKTFASLAN